MATVAELKKTVKGLLMPIPAVFDGKGEPDLPMMEKLTDWYLDSGVHGFFILGSQGQGPAIKRLGLGRLLLKAQALGQVV